MAKGRTWDNYCFGTAMPHGIDNTAEKGWLEMPTVLYLVKYRKCHKGI
jgi:hypothetical protein